MATFAKTFQPMTIFNYDGSFPGLLTAVFDAYQLRLRPDALTLPSESPTLFASSTHNVATDAEKSGRVWAMISRTFPPHLPATIMRAFVNATESLRFKIFRFICRTVDAIRFGNTINLVDLDLLDIQQASKHYVDIER